MPCAHDRLYAIDGTGIGELATRLCRSRQRHWTKLVQIIGMAGGKFGTFIWDQSTTKTKNGNTSSNYLGQLTLLEGNNVDAAFPQFNFASIIASITVEHRQLRQRTACGHRDGVAYVKQYAATVVLTDYVDGYDEPLWSDLVHPSQAGNIPYADPLLPL